MKMAQLQARLIAALDELDAQRQKHLRELTEERRAKEKLSAKLDGYLDEVKRAERQRDDMREMASILLEKVESSTDYSLWPCTRVDLPRPLGLLHVLDSDKTQPPALPDRQDASPGAIVALLQKQLADEKRAHVRTKEEADAQILRLEAKIARRDAELEACAMHSGHRVLLSASTSSDNVAIRSCSCRRGIERRRHGGEEQAVACPQHAAASDSEIMAVNATQARAASRNRVLEREVELLRRAVHTQHSRSPLHRKADDTAAPHPTTPDRRYVSVQVQANAREHRSEDRNHDEGLPPSPGLLPYVMPSSPSPYSMTPRHARTPALGHPSISRRQPVPRHASNSMGDYVAGLEHDIDALSAAIDDFASERAAAQRAILARERFGSSSAERVGPTHEDTTADINTHVEDECARERQALREQLLAEARERLRREQELQAEIASLKQALLEVRRDHAARPPPQQEERGAGTAAQPRVSGDLKALSASSPHVSPTLVPHDARASNGEREDKNIPHGGRGDVNARHPAHHGISALGDRGDADELGEQSMELATPLQTTILSLRDEDWPVPPSDIPVNQARRLSEVEPADVPPSPGQPNPSACLRAVSSPPLATSSGSPSPSPPPLPVAPPRVPMDLIARLESATEERVASIEREIAATQRELEEKEVALANLRITAEQQKSSQVDADEAIPLSIEGERGADDLGPAAGSL
ncbi:hypothetical protein OH77DRAFT_1523798 [Trametes cingulata]|nr:hypothetical protein OH77DRAFT_1523798 [Trametes cingulata]